MSDSNTAKAVLIIEDEKPLAEALQLKLQREGIIVTVATDGQEGLSLLRSQRFDVVLLDLIMPVLDGFQVLEQMKQIPGGAPVVFVLSNLSQQQNEERVLSLGARKFFIKSDVPLMTIVNEVKAV